METAIVVGILGLVLYNPMITLVVIALVLFGIANMVRSKEGQVALIFTIVVFFALLQAFGG